MIKHYEKALQSQRFLLLAHYASYAMQDLLFEYLLKHKALLVKKINFPLPELPFLKELEITTAENGKIIKVNKTKSLYSPRFIAYFFHCIQLFFIIVFSKDKYDLVIAQDSLLACVSIIIRLLGKCNKSIFYSHGFDNSRFRNRFLHTLYVSLDKLAARYSDYAWVLSKNMLEVRKKQGIAIEKIFWVPASIPIDSLKRKITVHSNKIIFIGVLDERNGVMILPDIIAEVKKKMPNVILDIIGDGLYYNKLQMKTKLLGLVKNINFFGKLNFEGYADTLTNYCLGIAPYRRSYNNLTNLTDPMKIRLYLAAGLPVVVTKGFYFSEEVKNNNIGFTVEYEAKEFANALIKLLIDENLNKRIRRNALVYSKKYDLHAIYDKTFEKIL